MHSLMFVSCFSMYDFTFDNNSKNFSRDILKWFLYISRSSLVHSTNNVFDVPNTLRLIFHSLTHQPLFFLKCVDILLLNSHILKHHLPAKGHLPPFWNRLSRSLLWNRVNSIVQPLNSVSLIQPRWPTWGTRVNAPYGWWLRHVNSQDALCWLHRSYTEVLQFCRLSRFLLLREICGSTVFVACIFRSVRKIAKGK